MAKKIGIILALDGEQKFAAGMKNAQNSVKLAQQELRNLDKECKGSANTLEALTERSKALAKVEEEYRKVLEKAKAGRENAVKNYQEAVKTLENYRQKQEELEKTVRSGGKSADQAAKELKEYRKAIESQEVEAIKAEAAITAWDTKVAKASSDVNRASREVRINSKYLAEAKDSADGCATSIDGFGKAIESAGVKAAESSEHISSASGAIEDVKKGFLSGVGMKMADSLVNVGQAAVEAAKKLIDAGIAAAAYADEVLSTADVTGMSTDRIQELTYAAGLMDTELSTVEGSMRKNLASMRSAAKGTGETSDAYKKLGVEITKADGTLRDSEDVYWDCIDALGKIEDRTERDAAAMQIFGKSAQELNPLISKGSKGFKELAEEAHNVGYVLDAETLGKLGAAQDSFDRLDVAGQNFQNTIGAAIAPALGGLADIATNVLNGVAGLFRDNRTEAEKYAEGIREALADTKELIDGTKGWADESAESVGKLEGYRKTLLEVIKAGEADEYQKYQVSKIVEELKDSVPELSEAWDEQAGTLKLTADEVNNLINAQEDYIKRSVAVKARQEAYEALYKAELEAAKAQGLLDAKLREAASEYGVSVENIQELNEAMDAWAINSEKMGTEEYEGFESLVKGANAAQKALDESVPVIQECKDQTAVLDDALTLMGEDILDVSGDAKEGLSEINETARKEMEAAGASVHGFGEAAREMADVVQGAFDEAHDSAEQAFSIDAFDSWEKNAENGIAKMQDALTKQAGAMQEYSKNFAIVSNELRDTSPEFLSYIQELGKDGAQLVEELARAFESGDTKAAEALIKKYEETLSAQDEIADISAKNTVALKKGLGELSSTAKEWSTFDEAIRKLKASGLPEALTEELEKAIRLAKEEGIKIPEGLASEIESSDDPADAAATCIGKLKSAIEGQKTALYNISHDTGHQVGAGFVLGLQEKYGAVQDAATGMINVALEKARARARIESPSKLFRDEVGVFISAGLAEGIKKGNSLTAEAAEASMNETLAAMKAWLGKHKAGVEEIAYTWQAAATSALKNNFGISRTKTEGSGDSAKTVLKSKSEYAGDILSVAASYLSNLKELYDVSTRQEISYWKSVRARLDSGTQAWITASGKIRKLQKQASQEAKSERAAEERSESQHYANRLSTMESYVSHREAMGRLSAKQERKYWQEHIAEFKKGSEQYKKISERFVALEAQIVSERLAKYESYVQRQTALQRMSITREKEYWEKRIAEFKKGSNEYKSIQERLVALEGSVGTSGVAASVLSTYQTYYDMSEKAEKQYWDIIRRTYKAGTADRLAADQAYLTAKEKLNSKLAGIESDYQDKIKNANARYKEAVASRKEAIYSAFSLFDAFESNSATGGDLLFNIQSQAAGYEEWIKSIKELDKRGIFSESLMTELREKGPTDIAAIKALLTLTDDQMKLYQEAYDRKNELSDKQAKAENADLKKEVKAEIKELKADMAAAMADASEPITEELKAVATKIESIAEDQTAAIVAAFTKDGSNLKGSVGSSVSSATKSAAGLSDYQTNGLVKRDADVRAQVEAEKARDEERRKAQAAADKKEEEAAAERRQREAEEEAKKAEKIKALDAIKSSNKLKAPLTAEQRKKHAAIYNYIADKYGVAASSSLYTRLASVFGLPKFKGTAKEKNDILKALKAHGLRSGTANAAGGAAWIDEELDTTGPEIIVRKSDKAILTRLEAKDAVIPADLAKNLFAWGRLSPENVGSVSMAYLNNKLAQAYAEQARSSDAALAAVNRIIGILGDYLPHLADGRDIYLDSDKLVGGLAEGMSRELARRSRRNVR